MFLLYAFLQHCPSIIWKKVSKHNFTTLEECTLQLIYFCLSQCGFLFNFLHFHNTVQERNWFTWAFAALAIGKHNFTTLEECCSVLFCFLCLYFLHFYTVQGFKINISKLGLKGIKWYSTCLLVAKDSAVFFLVKCYYLFSKMFYNTRYIYTFI